MGWRVVAARAWLTLLLSVISCAVASLIVWAAVKDPFFAGILVAVVASVSMTSWSINQILK